MENNNYEMTFADEIRGMEEFCEIMADPDRKGLTNQQIADLFAIKVPAIQSRLKNPKYQQLIREKRSERMQIDMPKIDQTLFQKAMTGDVKAIELIYERWDEFSRKTRTEMSGYLTATEDEAKKIETRKRLEDFLKQFTKAKTEDTQ